MTATTPTAIAWPMRPIVRRLVDDLGDFAGITWRHLTYIAAAAYVATSIPTGSPALIVAKTLVAALAVRAAALRSRSMLAEGPSFNRGIGVFAALAAASFWLAIFTVPSDLRIAVSHATFALMAGLLAWGPDDDDRGTPFVVRAWRRARTALARPAAVGAAS